MKLGDVLIVAIVSSLITFAGMKLIPKTHDIAASINDQPAFERVTQSRTIRCAYAIWAPYIMVDPNSKKISGFAYDMFEQIGKMLGVKIEWSEEVPYSQVADNLKSGRNDAFCMTLWPSANRAAGLDFTQAIDYIAAYAFVRANDTRFDGNISKLNDPNVTVAVIEGDYSKSIPDEDFPEAKQFSLSSDSDGAQLFLALTTKKADIAFADPFIASDYNKNNPGSIKAIANVQPARVFGDVFAVNKGETKLRDMINTPIQLLNQSGFTRQMLDKYFGDRKGEYFYPAKPYEPSTP